MAHKELSKKLMFVVEKWMIWGKHGKLGRGKNKVETKTRIFSMIT